LSREYYFRGRWIDDFWNGEKPRWIAVEPLKIDQPIYFTEWIVWVARVIDQGRYFEFSGTVKDRIIRSLCQAMGFPLRLALGVSTAIKPID